MLYDYQIDCKNEIYRIWASGKRRIMLVLPTGGGKTVIFADIMREYKAPSIAIAHRQEIVSQISLALARNEIYHRVIGPPDVVRNCRQIHLFEVGKNYVNPTSLICVAGVDTLIRRDIPDGIGLVVQDEAHHLLKDNKWGRALAMFPKAYVLGVTATPCRADGKGLGVSSDGFIEHLIVGPCGRDLIKKGKLSEYRIFSPPSDLILANIPVTSSGDYSPPKLSGAVKKSHIVGDVVTHYKKIAPGKRGITFAVSVDAAVEISDAYNRAGVSSAVITAKTPDLLRLSLLKKLRSGEILQIVNVDLFGEGMDVPALEVVTMARPTLSYGLYAQQFGRALRQMAGKEHAIIIDHVGNVMKHGLPDGHREWSLGRREKKTRDVKLDVPIRVCPVCFGVYEAYRKSCPYCGYVRKPSCRMTIEEVEGDLTELDPKVLEKMRGDLNRQPTYPINASPVIINSINKRFAEKTDAQNILRQVMAEWAGAISQKTDIDTLSEMQRRFYHQYGIDVLTAQHMNKTESEELCKKIQSRQS